MVEFNQLPGQLTARLAEAFGEPRRIGQMKYYLYVLSSLKYKKGYVGHTDNLDRRLDEHNKGFSIYTRRYKPWKIIYKEEFENLKEVISREKYFKSHAGRIKLKEVFSHCPVG